jgi:hypothetical protein
MPFADLAKIQVNSDRRLDGFSAFARTSFIEAYSISTSLSKAGTSWSGPAEFLSATALESR